MSSLICNACQVSISSDAERAVHYKAEWHRYNVKRRCAGLTSIPQSLFDAQLAALNSKKAAESAQKAEQACKVCKKSFSSPAAFQAHMTSKKHLKRVEKGGADEGEDEAEDDGEDDASAAAATPADAAAAAPASSADAASASLASLSLTPAAITHLKKKQAAAAASEGGAESKDDDAEELGEMPGEPIPLLTCLFCTKTFPEVAHQVEHMLKQHGFFIPFIENLVDLPGLLEYLGEQVGGWHDCMWCQSTFPSTQAAQMHMKAKSHCKLRIEDEDDEEALEEFYDFDIAEEDEEEGEEESKSAESGSAAAAAASSSSSALVAVSSAKDASDAPRRGGGGASSINDAGELVLADGSIVGSRQLKHLYKQHVRPGHVAKDIDAIAANYKRLALTTDVRENPRIYRRKREAFHLRARKREDLAKGLGGNFQFHFRAQVSY